MRPTLSLSMILGMLAPIAVFAQQSADQPEPSQPKPDKDVEVMCKQEIRKRCSTGFMPNRTAVQRCVKEKREEFPEQCRPVLDAMQKQGR